MAYSALADLILRLNEDTIIQLTDDANTGSVNSDVVSEAIEDADGLMDTYLRVRYAVPVASPPAVLTRISSILAICHLYHRRQGPPEYWATRCKEARDLLEDIAAGEVVIDGISTAGASESPASLHDNNPGRIFTRTKMEEF